MAACTARYTAVYSPQKSVHILIVLCVMVVTTVTVADTAAADSGIAVRTFKDTASAGWAYKVNDTAFVAEKDGVTVQWNVVEYKDREKKHLEVRRAPNAAFSQQVSLHRTVLEAIFDRWPPADFDEMNWGSFGSPADWSWCVPIAAASTRSELYKDYKKNYPNSKITSLNTLFIQLANGSDAYRPLKDLLAPFGVSPSLSSVEKVFAKKAEELPFYPDLKRQNIEGTNRVIYDVGMSWFALEAKK